MSNKDQNKYKNTNTGALFYNSYKTANATVFTANKTTPNIHYPAALGATGARFALFQVTTASADLSIELGASGSVPNPTAGSLKIGRTYGMNMVQLPIDENTQIKVLADMSGTPTSVSYNLVFID